MLNRLEKFAHIFLVYAALEDEIKKLDLPKETTDFLLNQEANLKGRLFSEIKKNPSISIDGLKSIIDKIKEDEKRKQELKSSSISKDDQIILNSIKNPTIKHWFTNVLLPKHKSQLSNIFETQRKLSEIDNWANDIDKEELGLLNLQKYDLDSLCYYIKTIKEKQAEGSDSSGDVVYGPSWKNEQYAGYTIVNLTEFPQLVYESSVLDHCIGKSDHYIEKIKSGESKIYSLRNPSGRPEVTMETSPDMWRFKQTFGHGNTAPSGNQVGMISEWKNSLHPVNEIENHGNDVQVAGFVSRGAHDKKIDELLKSNDIGRETLGSDVDNEPNSVLQALSLNVHLNESDYNKIYEKGSGSRTILHNLANNEKISDELYRKILREKPEYALKSIKAKILSYEEIRGLVNEGNIINILNNPSIKQDITKRLMLEFGNNINLDINEGLSYEPKFIDEYLSVVGYDNFGQFVNNLENMKEDTLKGICKKLGINYISKVKGLAIEKIREYIAKNDKDYNVRLEAVKKITDQATLSYIAKNDEDYNVRGEAVNKITDQDVLDYVAKKDEDEDVRHCAVINNNTNQDTLIYIAKNDESTYIRQESANKIKDQAVLIDIVKNDKDARVREAAVYNITDQAILIYIAKNDESGDVRFKATHKITDQNVLTDIAKNDKDARVRKEALRKVDNYVALRYFAINDEDVSNRELAIYKIKLIINNLTNQAKLTFIAKSEKIKDIRLEAINKLTDHATLIELVKNDGDEEIRELARYRLKKLSS